ncbi:hypothetical protein FGG08_007028 [Glutinoglossum americanum]|uniref:Uncharacterized protein n=1 Tax=Glutinoglossum americanum TaxID=1670608 RepID=A0A9P8HX39_9PEZI|nr:hypothetical protein FGG08_007028 [Glutinoglossum americanum]
MVDWAKAAVIVALCTIPLVLSPVAAQNAALFFRWLYFLIFKDKAHCDALCWDDLALEPLHSCQGNCCIPDTGPIPPPDVTSSRRHNPTTRCYESTFTRAFNTAWRGGGRRKVPRPQYLSIVANYLRTDVDTLLAFIVLTAPRSTGVWHTLPLSSNHVWDNAFAFQYGTFSGVFHRVQEKHGAETHFIGHLCGPLNPQSPLVNPNLQGLTKADVRHIAMGYPPFYRQHITTHSGVTIAHPIRTERDMYRGGWVIAIGLSTHEPAELYNARVAPIYGDACSRVLSTINKAITPSFAPSSEAAKLCSIAANAIDEMITSRTGSGIATILYTTPFQDCEGRSGAQFTQALTAEQCVFSLRLFNEFSIAPLDEERSNQLKPILRAVLAAAIAGVCKWWQYKNNVGKPLPEWLNDETLKGAPIWLTDCHGDES